MSVRRTSLLALALLLPLPAAADKLDKDSKKWLDEVGGILLPEERQTYEQLKDRAERVEFEKIFWARRDPNLETPENEYQKDWAARRADADKRFRVAGRAGSQTDCGRLLILLGEPDEVQKEPTDNPGLRQPETWTYKDRPTMRFQGGQAKIALDAECKLANPAAGKQLDVIAGGLIVNPNLTYRVQNGRITRLADLLPKPSPAQTLLKTPRQDFPVTTRPAYLKVEGGSTAVIGLVRADAAALTTEDAGGKKQARVTVAAQALNAEGRAVAFAERAVVAPVATDGSVVASYKMVVKPGAYEIRAGLVDDKSGKGSIASEQTQVPDLNKGELSAATLLVVSDIADTTSVEATDPDEAFFLGRIKLVPRFPAVFKRAEAPLFFYQAYDGQVDPATGKPSVTVGLTLSKGTKTVATAPEQAFDGPVVGGAIGPVPLEKYEPGTYTAKLKVRDNVAKKDLGAESTFEIVP